MKAPSHLRAAPDPLQPGLPSRRDGSHGLLQRRPADAPTVEVDVMVRLPRVQELSGLGRSTIYRLMAMQQFPNAVRLGPRAVGWRLSDIAAWNASRPCLQPGPATPAHRPIDTDTV